MANVIILWENEAWSFKKMTETTLGLFINVTSGMAAISFLNPKFEFEQGWKYGAVIYAQL